MKSKTLYNFIRDAIITVPNVKPLLSDKARFMLYVPEQYKTFDFMLLNIKRLVTGLYNNMLGGEFIDVMANIISGQLTQAYQQALEDQGFTDFFLPDYLQASLDAMILKQYAYVDGYFRAIIDARVDGTSLDPLLARAELWAQRYTEAYNEATRLIVLKGGGNLVWTLGATEQHCPECAALDGIVAWASEWDTLGVRPQNAPNDKLTCGGWRCDCSLSPTSKRRSPNAYGRIEEILLAR